MTQQPPNGNAGNYGAIAIGLAIGALAWRAPSAAYFLSGRWTFSNEE